MKQRTSMRIAVTLLVIITLLAALPFKGFCEVPHQISYQGNITDSLGNPIDGEYRMLFSIYDVPNDGTALWQENQRVSVIAGVYNIHLGINPTGNPFPANLFDGQCWLGVAVESDLEMVPRQLLTSTPFAKRAAVADRVADGAIETIQLARDAVTGDKIDDGAVSSSHIQDGAVLSEILDDAGSGSGLDADKLDGLEASAFMASGADYWVNETGDDMTGRLRVSVTPFDSAWNEAVRGSLLAGGSDVGAGVFGYSEGASAYGVRGSAVGSSGVGVYGEASGAGGTGVHGESALYGLYGEATGSSGIGVYGKSPVYGMFGEGSDTGNVINYGGYFRANGYNGFGVFGLSPGASGEGIHGTATGNYGRGVVGLATYTGDTTVVGGHFTAYSINGRGVYGESKGETGRGVYGNATNAGDVTNFGGFFEAAGTNGRGVFAEAPLYGVYGRAYGSNGLGVYGVATGPTGRAVSGLAGNTGDVGNFGGDFTARGSWGVGVKGDAPNTVSTNHGGFFTAAGSTGRGVYGGASGASGRGVYGKATNTGDVENYGGYFVAEGVTGRGVYGEATGQYGRGVSGIATSTEPGPSFGGSFTAHGWSGEGVRARAADNARYAVHAIAVDYGLGIGVFSEAANFDFYAAGRGTDYGSSSSIRWKQNIREIEDALEKVLQMRGVYFDWDEEHGGHHDMGFIAEEVGQHVPEIVSFEDDGEYAIGLDYSKMTPILLQAIKEQQGIISELRAEIEALKEDVKAIKAVK